MPELRLPSDQQRPGDPRLIGYQVEPGGEHLDRSASAARLLSGLVSMASPSTLRPLHVCLCHVRLAPRLPFNLFGFHILGITEDGDFKDETAEDDEILYALVANQPVELQREVTISLLNDLIGRQAPLADIAADRRDIRDLPEMTRSADSASAEASTDALRFGLEHAADALKTRAAAAGYRLEVRYQTDPLPRREDVSRRVRLFRELYRQQEDIRNGVDRTVAMIGGSPLTLRGGSELIRSSIQRHTALLGVRQFANQAIRDGDVGGNGYLEFGFLGLDPTLRCLRPEDVEVVASGRFRYHGDEPPRILDRVAHFRGLEQFESPYGISPWEPIIYVLQRKRILDAAVAQARMMLARGPLPERVRHQAESIVLASQALERDADDRIDKLLWYPRRMLPEVESDLYFSGQELLPE